MEPNEIPPPVDQTRIDALATAAEAEATQGKILPLMLGTPTGKRGKHRRDGPLPWASMRRAVAQVEEDTRVRVMGKPQTDVCPDCQAELPWVLVALGIPGKPAFAEQWQPPVHTCAAREARLAQEAADKAAERAAWEEHPPAVRVEAVWGRCHLPADAPAGLDAFKLEPRFQEAYQRVREHRELWLSGAPPKKGLWLYGPTNLRKSFMLAALTYDLSHRMELPGIFWNFSDLMRQKARLAQGKTVEVDPETAMEGRLLVLDDIGTANWTDAAYRTLYDTIEGVKSAWGHRHAQRVLYVTSNEPPRALERTWNEIPGYSDGGERITRRLLQLCEKVELK